MRPPDANPDRLGCVMTCAGSRADARALADRCLADCRSARQRKRSSAMRAWPSRASIAPMNAEELRQLQAPIKALYKQQPEAAKHLFRACGTLLPDRPSVRVETGFARYDAGLHEKAGGNGEEACSGDLLLESLVACAGVTFNVVATAMAVPFRSAKVVVEGEGDFRGTLGLAKDAAVGITDIRLRFEVDTDAGDDQLATLLRLTERYCVIFQTLRTPPRLSASVERAAAGGSQP
ncbi:MAG: OsmC family protein [Burkholderiales bacterium]|nr:OsmC family protein [Burkholderiales bacterium]